MSSKSKIRFLFLCVLALACGFWLTHSGLFRWRDFPRNSSTGSPLGYTPSYVQRSGLQLVMIYLGKGSCGWCRMEETRAIVREARDSLRVRADSLGFQFVLVGVGLDWDPSVSFEHLSSVSAFDEIGAGYNWANSFALRFLWGEWAGRASVPQIIVMTRVMVRSDTTWAAPVVEVRNEEMVARKIGVEELKTWRSNGFSVNLGAEEDPSLLGGKQG